MPDLLQLLVPIAVAAILVFVVSAFVHMLTPLHKADYGKLPGEDEVLETMRRHGAGRGHYVFPHCQSMADLDSPEMKAKLERGPIGVLILGKNGPMKMGPTLLRWFVYTLVISFLVAYIASIALPKGVESKTVFRFTATTAMLGYAFEAFPDVIWRHLPLGIAIKYWIDGVLYGLATGVAFTWLWPSP
ncbi:MAG: hypothetical protein KDC95_17255 [Planctomycetes bacterium]|nr:hypothetical protein [Planctomycetota bacterium]